MFNWLIHVGLKCNRKCNIDTVEEYINSEFISKKSIVNYFKPIKHFVKFQNMIQSTIFHMVTVYFKFAICNYLYYFLYFMNDVS